jgi:tetratricopeptide (TPR) repeat protein
MWIKALVPVVFFAGLVVVIGCNRADGLRPNRNNDPGSGDPSNKSDKEPALKHADAYAAQAYEWLCRGDYDKAIEDYDRAVQLKPDRAAFLNSRGFTWHMKGIKDKDRPTCEDRALADYAEALRIDPQNAGAINNRAWLWATSKVDRCRDGKQAVAEATKACELTGWKNAGYMDTLSVAYAEVGDFDQAIRWERKALADPSYQKEESENAREKLALYGKKQPFRE